MWRVGDRILLRKDQLGENYPSEDIRLEVLAVEDQELIVTTPWGDGVSQYLYKGDLDRYELEESSRVKHILSKYEI